MNNDQSLRFELLGPITNALLVTESVRNCLLQEPPNAPLTSAEIEKIKKTLEMISGFCQEAMEKIAIYTGEIIPGEHQHNPCPFKQAGNNACETP